MRKTKVKSRRYKKRGTRKMKGRGLFDNTPNKRDYNPSSPYSMGSLSPISVGSPNSFGSPVSVGSTREGLFTPSSSLPSTPLSRQSIIYASSPASSMSSPFRSLNINDLDSPRGVDQISDTPPRRYNAQFTQGEGSRLFSEDDSVYNDNTMGGKKRRNKSSKKRRINFRRKKSRSLK